MWRCEWGEYGGVSGGVWRCEWEEYGGVSGRSVEM